MITELEAVNEILASIGEAPIDTLEGDLTPDVAIARNTLNMVTKKVQSKGWDFNIENNYPLVPNTDGIIFLTNFLRVEVKDRSRLLVERAGKLYDKTNHTFQIIGTVYANVTFLFRFTEIPTPIQFYVTTMAAKIFQMRQVGSNVLDAALKEEFIDALIDAKQADGDTSNLNIFDNLDMMEALDAGERGGLWDY